MKKVLVIFSSILLALLVVLGIQFSIFNGAYTNTESGLQKWKMKILFWDFDEPPMDEYGIAGRWICAHMRECQGKWVKGALGVGASVREYWPPLILNVAKGMEISVIRNQTAVLSKADLIEKDKQGRTLFHWLSVHPDRVNAKELIEYISDSKNIDITNLRDIDGLNPGDWADNCSQSDIVG